MDRRSFIASSAAVGVSLVSGYKTPKIHAAKIPQQKPFNLKYAPSIGSFQKHAGSDIGTESGREKMKTGLSALVHIFTTNGDNLYS